MPWQNLIKLFCKAHGVSQPLNVYVKP